MNPRVLIVDDDAGLASLIAQALKDAGYKTHSERHADGAVSYLKTETPDVVLLDINLPGISGLKLLDLLKEEPKTSAIPVIMMTMRCETDTKVQGLKGGADDYIVKPFDTKELLARIDSLLRRVKHSGRIRKISQIADGAILIDFDRFKVTAAGKPIDLTPTEFQLLALLSRDPGHLYTYDNLREALTENKDITSGTLQSHVKNLRRKLGAPGEWIENVHGVGYKFKETL